MCKQYISLECERMSIRRYKLLSVKRSGYN